METTRLYELRGGAGKIIAIMTGVPCHECPERGHPRIASSNDFRSKLMEAVFAGAFPAMRQKRFGKTACFECGKRLKGAPRLEDRIEAPLVIDGASMTLTLTAPAIECPRCGCRQLRGGADVAAGVQKALDTLLARGRFQA
jgi:ssDNA-binding Zn-finger/Zn-ribbon topoisomerase 1